MFLIFFFLFKRFILICCLFILSFYWIAFYSYFNFFFIFNFKCASRVSSLIPFFWQNSERVFYKKQASFIFHCSSLTCSIFCFTFLLIFFFAYLIRFVPNFVFSCSLFTVFVIASLIFHFNIHFVSISLYFLSYFYSFPFIIFVALFFHLFLVFV